MPVPATPTLPRDPAPARKRAQQMLAFLRAFEQMTWDEQEAVYITLERAAAAPPRVPFTLITTCPPTQD